MRTKPMIWSFILVLLTGLLVSGCDTGPKLSADQIQVMENCTRLFTCLKVNDHNVLYENEFPYVHEEHDLEEYVGYPGIMEYRADSLMAIQIDSVTVWDSDTAYVHMQLEYMFSDSTSDIKKIQMRWWNVGDTNWIRPSISHMARQLEFEEELRVYWDAVRELERREEEREKEEGN